MKTEAMCGCYACIGDKPAYEGAWLTVGMSRMIVCALCGNKRCPHGTDHRHACTGSNEPGQDGSRYPALNLTPSDLSPQERARAFLDSLPDDPTPRPEPQPEPMPSEQPGPAEEFEALRRIGPKYSRAQWSRMQQLEQILDAQDQAPMPSEQEDK